MLRQIQSQKLLQNTYWSSMSNLPDLPENYKTITNELTPENNGTRLTITQDNNNSADDRNQSEQNWKMVLDGLKKVADLDPVELKKGNFKIIVDEDGDKNEKDDNYENKKDKFHYRYKQIEDSIREKAKDKMREERKVIDSIEREKKLKEVIKTNAVNTNEKDNDAAAESVTGSHIISPIMIFSEI